MLSVLDCPPLRFSSISSKTLIVSSPSSGRMSSFPCLRIESIKLSIIMKWGRIFSFLNRYSMPRPNIAQDNLRLEIISLEKTWLQLFCGLFIFIRVLNAKPGISILPFSPWIVIVSEPDSESSRCISLTPFSVKS